MNRIIDKKSNYIGQRIDKYLVTIYKEHSRSHIQKWIKDGCVSINQKIVKSNYKLQANDEIIINEPEIKEVAIISTDMELDIIYEDEDLLIINKPAGLVVHPAPGHYNDTLVNGIMAYCKENLSGINGELRPGIVHRIDKDTTGLLIVCKNDQAHRSIAKQLKAHSIHRIYEAIVFNNFIEDEGEVKGPIGRHPNQRKRMSINYKTGKEAITHYKVLDRLKKGFTHVELQLETGRTHQIRVHLTSIGHPILGDPLYGPKKQPFKIEGQLLHAKTIGFIHPRTNEFLSFTVKPPDKFRHILSLLEKEETLD